MAATMKRGSRGDGVKELQEALNAAGANLTVDGIYGPATEAAVKKYQKDNDYQQNGAVGPTLQGIMGLTGSVTEGGTGPVATSKTGSDLILPGNPELWYDTDTKQYIVVYVIPPVKQADGSMTDEMYLSWTVEDDKDLEAVAGVDIDPVAARTLSQGELTKLGVVNFGAVSEFRDFEHIEGDPLETWAADMAEVAKTQPWILDEEWHQLSVMAMLEREDGQLSTAEIRATNWWKTHSDAERRWLETFYGDPATAANWKEDSRANMAKRLKDAGINNAPTSVLNYMADQVVQGHWTQEKLMRQIAAISDPYANEKVDAGLLQELSDAKYSPDHTQKKEDTVRGLLQRWLGPAYGNWTDKQIADKAGELRNDPDSEINFIESLKDQRVGVIPGVTDRETSYQDLANPWKTFGRASWGREMDEMDPMFLKMLNNNDATANGSLLAKEGLKRDVGKVVTDTRNAMSEAWGGPAY